MRASRGSVNALLDLELRVLVARHGHKRVSDTLSRIGEIDPSALASVAAALEATEKKKSARKRSARVVKSVDELICDLDTVAPAVRELLGKLGHAYEAKTFLPALRQVRHFLEGRGGDGLKFRSRRDALPAVLSALSRLPVEELRLIDTERLDTRSDLGIIADQILGSPGGTPTNDLSAEVGAPSSEASDSLRRDTKRS